MKPYQTKPEPRHHPPSAIFYACSVLALTAAMWFCAGVYGYHAGLELRPAAAEAETTVETETTEAAGENGDNGNDGGGGGGRIH